MTSRPASSQVSYEMGKDTTQTSGLGGKPEVKSHNSGIFGKVIDCVVTEFFSNR